MTAEVPMPSPGGTFPVAGRSIARIGYGMGGLTRSVTDATRQAAALALLRRALDLGVVHYDTAQFYADGLANSLLRQAFTGKRDDVFYASKVGARPVPGMPPMTAAQRPHELRQTVEDNLRSLGTDRLDLVYLRRMDVPPGLVAAGDQRVNLADQLAELVALRQEGKIGALGLSHVSMDQVSEALPAGVAAVSNIYSLIERRDEPLLELCRGHGIAWAPYFPLGGGGGFADFPRVIDDERVRRVAADLGATPSQVGIAWQLQHAPNTLLISGTSSIAHLEENVRAGGLRLTTAQLEVLA